MVECVSEESGSGHVDHVYFVLTGIRDQLMSLYQRIDTPKPKAQAPAQHAKHAAHAQQKGVVMHSITGEPLDAQSPEDHNNNVGCGFEPDALEQTHAAGAAAAAEVTSRKRSLSATEADDGEIPDAKAVRVA